MPNGSSLATTLELDVPTYLSLSDVAEKYNLSVKALTQLVQTGKIEAVQTPSGELLVSAENGQPKSKEDILIKEFADIRGHSVTVTEGSEKYNLPRTTISSRLTSL